MLRKRIFEIIEPARSMDRQSRIFDHGILCLILLNVLAVILESFSGIYFHFEKEFEVFEILSITVFTLEYLARIATADFLYRDSKRWRASYSYICSPMALIDLLAILPFFLPMVIPLDLRFLRILRLTRILRVLKINRYTKSLNMIACVLKRKKEDLFVTLFVTFLLLLLAASVMYYVESDIQPEGFPNIIASLWWAVATLTTVGYGDVFPISVIGKVLSGIIALLGIALWHFLLESLVQVLQKNWKKSRKTEIIIPKHINIRKERKIGKKTVSKRNPQETILS